MLVGAALSVIGLALFFKVGGTPLSTAGFPDGPQPGQDVLGFEVNAWTAWLTTAAGVLLLFASEQHLLAKGVSLIVGLALAFGAVFALIDGTDVLGLAAANALTALIWGGAAAILLANTFSPRLKHERVEDHGAARTTDDDMAHSSPRQDAGATERAPEPAVVQRSGGEGSLNGAESRAPSTVGRGADR